ncbi:hypothetical protein ACHAWO_010663 [Cyclotella atomus]|uniref:Uncharacterized protein n=1 Tax=Cyclotella atomus TaxID=382360 RepID=A0ABD3QRK6_9STRA
MKASLFYGAETNVSLGSHETLTTDETQEDIERIASEIESQDDVEKQKPDVVNAEDDSPIPFAQMMNRFEDVNDEIQYSCKANKVDCNDSTANQGQSAEPPQEAPQEQGTEVSQD